MKMQTAKQATRKQIEIQAEVTIIKSKILEEIIIGFQWISHFKCCLDCLVVLLLFIGCLCMNGEFCYLRYVLFVSVDLKRT